MKKEEEEGKSLSCGFSSFEELSLRVRLGSSFLTPQTKGVKV